MAAGTVATAAGAAMLLYYLLSRGRRNGGGEGAARSEAVVVVRKPRRAVRRPAQAPATWLETLTTLSETLRFTYSETLGKWPIHDLAFGINYLLRKQGNLNVASVYAGEGCVELKGPEIVDLCHHLVRLLTLCYFFSKKPFPVFLELVGYSQEDVVIQKPKAGILKPAFTIIHDKNLKRFILLIRGTHSIKDTLTAATGAGAPFHHSIVDKGVVSNLVLGYAHRGMVAAALWIAKVITPCLIKALSEYPDHELEVVGHSLGGGTAALLTYILREQKEFSSSTCITFGSAACMTWDLAESGKPFITSIINGSDLVPTVSAASVDGLRSEVTASSWLNDLRDQVEHTRVLNVVYRSATALGSHLPSVASARARVAGAGALLRPVSSSTQVVIKRAQDVAQAVRTRSSLSSWSCIGPRRRAVSQQLGSNVEKSAEVSLASESSEALLVVEHAQDVGQTEVEHNSSSGSGQSDTEEDEFLVSRNGAIASSNIEEVTEGELWYELEKQLQRQEAAAAKDHIQVQEEEAAAAKEIIEEEKELVIPAAETSGIASSPEISESQRFYPPGRILHIVSKSSENGDMDHDGPLEEHVAFYETPRDLYSRIRLSKTMIHDHYMPIHKKMIELIIKQLEHDDDCSVVC